MKSAASLDGKTALHNGVSQWITSQAARDDGHIWRARLRHHGRYRHHPEG
jgi:diaminohydroxyphosphoribosylaminopyrimidine deaminase/5-amino-6-(5-phosphoribosylamino)uracil reductase